MMSNLLLQIYILAMSGRLLKESTQTERRLCLILVMLASLGSMVEISDFNKRNSRIEWHLERIEQIKQDKSDQIKKLQGELE